MYQVLLVDDEALITDGLAEYLARRAPERFEILKAYSGAGALEIAGRMRVDILVTDIEMLGMDGLAVRQRVQALWPQCRAIFLTAHANFEYAYQAIQDPPARYLLKSEGFERLAQILEQTAAELDEALYNESLLREAQNAREGNLQKVMLLSAILRGEMAEEEEMARGFAELGIDLRAGEAVLPLLVRLYAPARQGYRLAAVSGYIRRQADGACLCEAVPFGQNELACFLQGPGRELALQSQMELWHEAFSRICGGDTGIALGARTVSWREAGAVFQRMSSALSGAAGEKNVFIIYQPEGKDAPLLRREAFRQALQRQLRAGESPWPLLEEIYAAMPAREAGLLLAQCVDAARAVDSAQMLAWSEALESLPRAQSANEAARLLQQLSSKVRTEQTRASTRQQTQIVQTIDHYIAENYSRDIALSDVAAQVYLSPAYVSSLYKRLRGAGIMDTVLRTRMARAQELLVSSNRQIQQIAAEVGYHSARYFISSFRNYCGLSPNAYREKYWNAKEEPACNPPQLPL